MIKFSWKFKPILEALRKYVAGVFRQWRLEPMVVGGTAMCITSSRLIGVLAIQNSWT